MQPQPETNPPILASIPETGHQLRVGRTKVYELIGRGELETVKIDKRRLVVRASIGRLIERLAKRAA